jgi:23S rRNA G2069 N7-methylase RlmK/C1962 C5-methylase RlmI
VFQLFSVQRLLPDVLGKLLDEAIDKRDAILDGGTDALRLVDGAGDAVPGFALES